MKEFERARNDEQKEVRIQAIVAAAERLYAQHELPDITIAALAKEAEFTRSNVYRYFRTKEEVYLEVLRSDLAHWTEEVEAAFEGDGWELDAFAETWARVLTPHGRMLDLLTVLHPVLERNSSVERLVQFKVYLRSVLARTAELLCRAFPGLEPEDATQFLYLQISLAVGLFPMAHPTERQREAVARSGLDSMEGRFERNVADATTFLLRGLLDRRKREDTPPSP